MYTMIMKIKNFFYNFVLPNRDNSFYLKTALTAWLTYCLVYSFMIFQFCWGNHDWWFLKDRVHISDGFFEARYNQHIFSVLLFNGQILPVVVYLVSFAVIAVFALLLATYLEVPRTPKNWIIFSLLIGLNPHIFVLFSYVFIMLPFVCWGAVSICVLFLIAQPYRGIKLFSAIICCLLVLGGYPPIIGFICTAFVAKQLILYVIHNVTLKQIMHNSLVFIFVLGMSLVIYKFVMILLIAGNDDNTEMYNTRMISHTELIKRFFYECMQAGAQLWLKYPFLDEGYWKILLFILLGGCIYTFYISENKKITFLLLMILFVASRTAFIVAEKAYLASFRLSYWGKLGLYAFAWSILLHSKKLLIKNLVFAVLVVCLWTFIQIDFEIQKTWNLGFKAERMAHARLSDRIMQNPAFNHQQKYVFLNLGIPFYKQRFYSGKTIMEDNELLSILTLPADLGEILFWEEENNPVVLKLGVWENRLWRVNDQRFSVFDAPYFNTDDDIFSRLRYWMYMEAAPYPSEKSIYIDNQYIVVVIDRGIFNKNRELVIGKMKSLLD